MALMVWLKMVTVSTHWMLVVWDGPALFSFHHAAYPRVALQTRDPVFWEYGLLSAHGTGESEGLLRSVANQTLLTECVEAR